jgi:hypothetical protein
VNGVGVRGVRALNDRCHFQIPAERIGELHVSRMKSLGAVLVHNSQKELRTVGGIAHVDRSRVRLSSAHTASADHSLATSSSLSFAEGCASIAKFRTRRPAHAAHERDVGVDHRGVEIARLLYELRGSPIGRHHTPRRKSGFHNGHRPACSNDAAFSPINFRALAAEDVDRFRRISYRSAVGRAPTSGFRSQSSRVCAR